MGLLGAISCYATDHEGWEAVCARCGRCCFVREAGADGSVAVNYAEPCRFLDMDTHRCRVYAKRFEECPECHRLTPATVFFQRHLPKECAYVQKFRNTDRANRTGPPL